MKVTIIFIIFLACIISFAVGYGSGKQYWERTIVHCAESLNTCAYLLVQSSSGETGEWDSDAIWLHEPINPDLVQ